MSEGDIDREDPNHRGVGATYAQAIQVMGLFVIAAFTAWSIGLMETVYSAAGYSNGYPLPTPFGMFHLSPTATVLGCILLSVSVGSDMEDVYDLIELWTGRSYHESEHPKNTHSADSKSEQVSGGDS